ncbi:hypothetical protein HBN50_01260 [Halobacteriovorax sp. GB3]|uniref:hypothetical protein n=1 Tax=Halobacteriovorax sp. GB3 TaxID=2719615 RepID=UPI00235E490B|nr:hypothetical protein [Halobacteriovorax sp. GB3]MDD0851696.1 hypothetical protein [Halobacteriovorax sp. GB3]
MINIISKAFSKKILFVLSLRASFYVSLFFSVAIYLSFITSIIPQTIEAQSFHFLPYLSLILCFTMYHKSKNIEDIEGLRKNTIISCLSILFFVLFPTMIYGYTFIPFSEGVYFYFFSFLCSLALISIVALSAIFV